MDFFRIAARVAVTREATDRSFAESIRNVLVAEIHKQLPGKFDPELYDTNPQGKGYAAGYISFALKPSDWKAADLIGGILFRCIYDTEDFRSEKPEGDASWMGHSKGKNFVEIPVEAGYYNKRLGGGLTNPTYLGDIEVLVMEDESTKVSSIDNMAREIESIIAGVIADPPAAAIKPKKMKPSAPPTSSPQAMLKWLNEQNRNVVMQSEIDLMARQKNPEAPGTAKLELERWFQSRGISVDKTG